MCNIFEYNYVNFGVYEASRYMHVRVYEVLAFRTYHYKFIFRSFVWGFFTLIFVNALNIFVEQRELFEVN